MRNISLLYLFLLFIMVACETEPSMDGSVISFSADIDFVETRARVEGETFPDGSSFGVLGYCLAFKSMTDKTTNASSGTADWNTKKIFCAPRLFYKQEVTKSDGNWSYTPEQGTTTALEKDENSGLLQWYANSDFKYTFFAYFPFTTGSGNNNWIITPSAYDAIGEPSAIFTINDFTNVPDLMTASLVDTRKGDGNIKLKFQHHLTGLKIRFTNYDKIKREITSISIGGSLYNTLTVDLNTRIVGGNYQSPLLIPLNVTNNNNIMQPFDGENADDYESGEILLLSNREKFGENVQIAVQSVAENADGTKIDRINFDTEDKLSSFKPEPGVVYTIDVAYRGTGIVIISVVADNGAMWEGGTSTDSDILFE